jgi:SAM-dependent methyltransferase
VICQAEELPFDDASFDIVVCRRAAHHFSDVAKAVQEMGRVTKGLVLVQDAIRVSDQVEEAERLRDPSHKSHYTEGEWREFFASSGLNVEAAEGFAEYLDFASWFARTGCQGETADRVRELLADRSDDHGWTYPYVVFRARKSS